MNVRRPNFTLTINGRDITADMKPYAISVRYTDRLAGESDEVAVVLNNSDQRFTKDWYFSKGDTLTLGIGYDRDITPCGTFTIDQIECSGPPDTVTVRALAAGTNSPLRTKRSEAHQDKSIAEIAKTVADSHGYTIQDGTAKTSRIQVEFGSERSALKATSAAIRRGLRTLNIDSAIQDALRLYEPTIEAADSLVAKNRGADGTEIRQTAALWRAAWQYKQFPDRKKTTQAVTEAADRLDAIIASLVDIDRTVTRSKLDTTIAWSTQDQETDLEYLARVAGLYGVIFSVRGTVMVFTSLYDVEGAEVLGVISRGDVETYHFRDKAVKNYAGVRVVWHDPNTGEVVESVLSATQPDGQPRSGDTLEIRTRIENQTQADQVAKAMLHRHTSAELEGDLTMEGRPTLCAGANVSLSGFGVMDGKWLIEESDHPVEVAGGYTTTIKIRRGR